MSRIFQNQLLSQNGMAALAAVVCIFLSASSFAATQQTVTGVAIVNEQGLLSINGQKITLWGMDSLAPDQQCWQGDTAWCCGEEAMLALKHDVDGKTVSCDIQIPADHDGPASGKCYRVKGQTKRDIVEQLVRHGWAMDRGEVSGGIYYQAEAEAQNNKRGIWTSRFQTAKDWKDGIQRFVGDEDQSEPER